MKRTKSGGRRRPYPCVEGRIGENVGCWGEKRWIDVAGFLRGSGRFASIWDATSVGGVVVDG